MSARLPVTGGCGTGAAPPEVAWPAAIDRPQAEHWVRRRLPAARGLELTMYHHPMMGIEFEWQRRRREPIWINVLVDLVGGRAYAAEPWHDCQFEPLPNQTGTGGHLSPARQLCDEQAREHALRLADSVLLRRRRLDAPGRLRHRGELLYFGKPNWWITGEQRGRRVEVILDALTGRHYAFSA